MKPSRFLVPMLVAGGVMGLPAGSLADDLTPQNAPNDKGVPTTQPSARSAALIQAIRQAPDPSAAIQAYADARVGEPGSPEAQRAYVQRMVELGLPEMAGTQAQDLLRHNGEDGQAWAVAAYIAAKRDDRSLAIYDAAQATRFAPDDPFVMRTAGQVVAWYDRDKLAADESTRSSVETIRQRLAGQQGYAEAYGNAAAAYKKLGQGGSPSPATTEPSPAAVQTESAPAPTTYAGPVYEPETPIYNNSYAYYYPSYPAGPSYPYWWPNYGFGAFWWWPSFSSVVIIDDDFHHHHHDIDSFHDHHHDFDDPHFFHHDGDFSRHERDGFADSHFHGHDGDFFGNGRHDFGGAGFVGHHDDMRAMTAAGHLDPAPARSPSAWQTMGAARGGAAQPRQIDSASVHGGLPWGAMNQAQRAPQRIEGGSFHGTSSWGGGGMATPPMVTRSAPAAPTFAAASMHASAPMPAMPAAGAMPAGAGMGGMHGGGRGGGGHR